MNKTFLQKIEVYNVCLTQNIISNNQVNFLLKRGEGRMGISEGMRMGSGRLIIRLNVLSENKMFKLKVTFQNLKYMFLGSYSVKVKAIN